MMPAPEDPHARTDRQLGWLMSLSGLLVLGGQAIPGLFSSPSPAVVWAAGGILLCLIVLGCAAVGLILPLRLLRWMWVASVLLHSALLATTFVGYAGADPDAVLPWAWAMEPVIVSYLVLLVRPWLAAALALCSALIPALSALSLLGFVPDRIAENTPAHLANIGFTVIFLSIRVRMRALNAAEARLGAIEEARIAAAADAAERERVHAFVHDEVLSVLTAAASFRRSAPAALRAEAERAAELLEEQARPRGEGTPADPVGPDQAVALIRETVVALHPGCEVVLVADRRRPEGPPAAVLDAVARACAEAVRNVVRHAGPGAEASCTGRIGSRRIAVTIRDTGAGFDPEAIPPGRLGVQESILARMAALPGGEAEVRAVPGRGTEVSIRWRA